MTGLIAAYQGRFPKDESPEMERSDPATFAEAVDRLFAAIRPKPYFWLASTPLPERKELMERLAVPADYFEPLFDESEMAEESCPAMLDEAVERCENMMKRFIQKKIDREKCWWAEKEE